MIGWFPWSITYFKRYIIVALLSCVQAIQLTAPKQILSLKFIDKFVLPLCLMFWLSLGEAAPSCYALTNYPKGAIEIAKEVELNGSDAGVLMMEPIRPRVSELVPTEFQKIFFEQFFPTLSAAERSSLEWSQLRLKEKWGVLKYLGMKANFDLSRAIPKMRLQRYIRFTPATDVTFRGKQFRAGIEAIADLSGFLLPRIEYAIPWAPGTEAPTAVEMHFRGLSPTALHQDVMTFFREVLPYIKGLEAGSSKDYGVDPISDHVHVPAKRPSEYISRLRSKGFSDLKIAKLMALYHSLVETNMILMNLLIHPKTAIGELPTVLGFLSLEKWPTLISFYQDIVSGNASRLSYGGSDWYDLKNNNAGARDGQTYADKSLWGFELRILNGIKTSKHYLPIVESVKKAMDNQKFPESDVNFEPGDVLLSKDPFKNAERFEDPILRELALKIADKYSNNFKVKDVMDTLYSPTMLLLFDWSRHPLVRLQPEFVEQIKTIQLKYLRLVYETGLNSEQIKVEDFFRETKLGKFFLNILGATLK